MDMIYTHANKNQLCQISHTGSPKVQGLQAE